MKRAIVIILSVIIGLVMLIYAIVYFSISSIGFKEEVRNSKIYFNTDSSILYVKARVWGISGDHEEIVLSQSDKDVANKTTDYIFYTSEVYYKTKSNGVITLYAPESLISEPVSKFSNIVVDLKGLKTSDEIKDYKKNYQKYGLQKISAY